jgi:hypothetical membrane protein
MLALIAFMLALLTAAVAALVPAYFGRLKPGYSHLRNTISELGEAGSPIGSRVSYFGFVPIGLLLWLFLAVAAKAAPSSAIGPFGVLAIVGLGYVGGGIFRCDAGAPSTGSLSTILHNLFGAGEYLGAAAAFAMLSADSYWSPLSGITPYGSVVIVACLWGIGFPHRFRGLLQRIAETVIFAGVVLIGFWIYREGA